MTETSNTNFLACENIRFSTLFAGGDVSRETSPTIMIMIIMTTIMTTIMIMIIIIIIIIYYYYYYYRHA